MAARLDRHVCQRHLGLSRCSSSTTKRTDRAYCVRVNPASASTRSCAMRRRRAASDRTPEVGHFSHGRTMVSVSGWFRLAHWCAACRLTNSRGRMTNTRPRRTQTWL